MWQSFNDRHLAIYQIVVMAHIHLSLFDGSTIVAILSGKHVRHHRFFSTDDDIAIA